MKRPILLLGVTLAAVFSSVGPVTAQAPAETTQSENVLKAGIAKVDITPDKPVKMSGCASRKGLSTGVHDPLYARIVAFQSGSQRLVSPQTLVQRGGIRNRPDRFRARCCRYSGERILANSHRAEVRAGLNQYAQGALKP